MVRLLDRGVLERIEQNPLRLSILLLRHFNNKIEVTHALLQNMQCNPLQAQSYQENKTPEWAQLPIRPLGLPRQLHRKIQ
jgi:hypothetical protein